MRWQLLLSFDKVETRQPSPFQPRHHASPVSSIPIQGPGPAFLVGLRETKHGPRVAIQGDCHTPGRLLHS